MELVPSEHGDTGRLHSFRNLLVGGVTEVVVMAVIMWLHVRWYPIFIALSLLAFAWLLVHEGRKYEGFSDERRSADFRFVVKWLVWAIGLLVMGCIGLGGIRLHVPFGPHVAAIGFTGALAVGLMSVALAILGGIRYRTGDFLLLAAIGLMPVVAFFLQFYWLLRIAATA